MHCVYPDHLLHHGSQCPDHRNGALGLQTGELVSAWSNPKLLCNRNNTNLDKMFLSQKMRKIYDMRNKVYP